MPAAVPEAVAAAVVGGCKGGAKMPMQGGIDPYLADSTPVTHNHDQAAQIVTDFTIICAT